MTTLNTIRSDFHYALDQDKGFGRKVLTGMLLLQLAALVYSITLFF